jgi:hypothetical protein
MHIPVPLNLDVLKWAKETHDILSSTKLPESVKFYNIYGIDYDTPHTVCYGSERHPVSNLSHLLYAQVSSSPYCCVLCIPGFWLAGALNNQSLVYSA